MEAKVQKKGRFTIQEVEDSCLSICEMPEMNVHHCLRRRYSIRGKICHELVYDDKFTHRSDKNLLGHKSSNFVCKVLDFKSGKHLDFQLIWRSVPKKVQREFTQSHLFRFDDIICTDNDDHISTDHFDLLTHENGSYLKDSHFKYLHGNREKVNLSVNSTLLETSFELVLYEDGKKIARPSHFTLQSDVCSRWKASGYLVPSHANEVMISR